MPSAQPAIIILCPNAACARPDSLSAALGFKVATYTSIPPQDRLSTQATLLAHLSNIVSSAPGESIALELRYVISPGAPERNIPSAVDFYALARYTAWDCSTRALRARARLFADDLREVITLSLPQVRLLAVEDAAVLRRALKPVVVRDTVELRRPYDANAYARAHNVLGMLHVDNAIHVLLAGKEASMLSICVSPLAAVTATASPDGLDERAQVYPRAHPAWQLSPDASDPQMPAKNVTDALRAMFETALAVPQPEYAMRIQLASGGRIPQAAISSLINELTRPQREMATFQPANALTTVTSRAIVVRPRSTRRRGQALSEFATATANLERLEFAPWGTDTQAERAQLYQTSQGDAARLFGLPNALLWLTQHGFALQLPFTVAIREGIHLGTSPSPAGPRDVIVPFQTRAHHTWIMGQTGTGKTTLMTSMIYQDILAGRSVIVMDPHGDMIEHLLKIIPESRMDDVILFDPRDRKRTLGINPLDCEDDDQQTQIINAFIGLLIKLYDPHQQGIIGPRFEHNVRNVMYTVMATRGLTLVEVLRALTDDRYVRQALLPHVTDPLVKRYWTDQIAQTNSYHRSEILDWLVSKFSHFVTDKRMRRVLGQGQNSFSFREAMDTGKIVLLDLAKGVLGHENSQFFGLIALPMILQAAISRANIPESERREVSVYVDEVQNFATDSIAQMLAEARKYRMALTLANQHAGQLSGEIFDALLGNAGTMLSFRLGSKDAPAMAQMLAPSQVNEQHLKVLPNYVAYGRMVIEGQRTPVFTLNTEPVRAAEDEARAEEIRRRSRERYARANEDIDAEVMRRSGMEPQPESEPPARASRGGLFPAFDITGPLQAPHLADDADESMDSDDEADEDDDDEGDESERAESGNDISDADIAIGISLSDGVPAVSAASGGDTGAGDNTDASE